MDVRRATIDDAEAIARVQERGWQVAYRHVFPRAVLDRGGFIEVERWRRRLSSPPPGWSTLVAGDPVAGFASVGPGRNDADVGELYALYVEPGRWSTGIGGALIRRAEEVLARDFDDAVLWVLEDNPRARRFYERAGWALDPEGTQDGTWFDVTVREVRYRKRLTSSRSRS